MNQIVLQKIIASLKILLKIDNLEIVKYTIESLIEELEEMQE